MKGGFPCFFFLHQQKFFQDSSSSPGTGKWIFNNWSLDTDGFLFQPDPLDEKPRTFLGPETETNEESVGYFQVSPFGKITSKIFLSNQAISGFPLAMSWCLSLSTRYLPSFMDDPVRYIDCLKQIHSLTFSQIYQMSIHWNKISKVEWTFYVLRQSMVINNHTPSLC